MHAQPHPRTHACLVSVGPQSQLDEPMLGMSCKASKQVVHACSLPPSPPLHRRRPPSCQACSSCWPKPCRLRMSRPSAVAGIAHHPAGRLRATGATFRHPGVCVHVRIARHPAGRVRALGATFRHPGVCVHVGTARHHPAGRVRALGATFRHPGVCVHVRIARHPAGRVRALGATNRHPGVCVHVGTVRHHPAGRVRARGATFRHPGVCVHVSTARHHPAGRVRALGATNRHPGMCVHVGTARHHPAGRVRAKEKGPTPWRRVPARLLSHFTGTFFALLGVRAHNKSARQVQALLRATCAARAGTQPVLSVFTEHRLSCLCARGKGWGLCEQEVQLVMARPATSLGLCSRAG